MSKVSTRWTKAYCSFMTMSQYISRGLHKLLSMKVSLIRKIIHPTVQIWPPAITTYWNFLSFVYKERYFLSMVSLGLSQRHDWRTKLKTSVSRIYTVPKTNNLSVLRLRGIILKNNDKMYGLLLHHIPRSMNVLTPPRIMELKGFGGHFTDNSSAFCVTVSSFFSTAVLPVE